MNGTDKEYSKMMESFEHIREFSFGVQMPEFTDSPRKQEDRATESNVFKGKKIYSIQDSKLNFHGMYIVDSRDQSSICDEETGVERDIRSVKPERESIRDKNRIIAEKMDMLGCRGMKSVPERPSELGSATRRVAIRMACVLNGFPQIPVIFMNRRYYNRSRLINRKKSKQRSDLGDTPACEDTNPDAVVASDGRGFRTSVVPKKEPTAEEKFTEEQSRPKLKMKVENPFCFAPEKSHSRHDRSLGIPGLKDTKMFNLSSDRELLSQNESKRDLHKDLQAIESFKERLLRKLNETQDCRIRGTLSDILQDIESQRTQMETEILKERRQSGLIKFNFQKRQTGQKQAGVGWPGEAAWLTEAGKRRQPVMKGSQGERARRGGLGEGPLETASVEQKLAGDSCEAQFRMVRNELSQHMHNLDDTILRLTKNYDQFHQSLVSQAGTHPNAVLLSNSRFQEYQTAVTDSQSTRKASGCYEELSPLNTISNKTNPEWNLQVLSKGIVPQFFQKNRKLDSWGKDKKSLMDIGDKSASRLSVRKVSNSTKRSQKPFKKKELDLNGSEPVAEVNE
jgi:hypothetical protein